MRRPSLRAQLATSEKSLRAVRQDRNRLQDRARFAKREERRETGAVYGNTGTISVENLHARIATAATLGYTAEIVATGGGMLRLEFVKQVSA